MANIEKVSVEVAGITNVIFNKVSISNFINEDLNIYVPYSNLFFALADENYNHFKIIGTACRQEHLTKYLTADVIKKHGLTHVYYDSENANYQKTGVNEHLVSEHTPKELWFINNRAQLTAYSSNS